MPINPFSLNFPVDTATILLTKQVESVPLATDCRTSRSGLQCDSWPRLVQPGTILTIKWTSEEFPDFDQGLKAFPRLNVSLMDNV
jgi:hypothetical protein